MKVLKKWITFFIIYSCSLQMSFGAVIYHSHFYNSRNPSSSYGHEIELSDLFEELKLFHIKIKGEEVQSDCKPSEVRPDEEQPFEEEALQSTDPNLASSNIENEFDEYFKNLSKNACGFYVYSFDEEEKEEEKDCKVKKIPGMIDRITLHLIEEEKKDEDDQKDPEAFKVMDAESRNLHKEAEFLMSEVVKYLHDSGTDKETYKDKKRKLLITYLRSVALPMRDLIVMKRAYMEKEYDGAYYYNSLLPNFPTELFPAGDLELRAPIVGSPKSQDEKLYLKINEKMWGVSEIKYDESQILARDLLTLIKAPTSRNYIRSLKWMTLQMMLSQITIYQSLDGGSEEKEVAIDIPRSCQNHFNGDLPESLSFKFKKGEGNLSMSGILSGQGLIPGKAYFDYFDINVNTDPTTEGYSGIMPFENYKYANKFKEFKDGLFSPVLDDMTHFETVMDLRRELAFKVFKKEKSINRTGESGEMTHVGEDLFKKILGVPKEGQDYEITLDNGETIAIDPLNQNLSVYLAELLQRKNVSHFKDAISHSLKEEFSKKRLKIDFPPLYGSVVWRNWGLITLRKFLITSLEKREPSLNRIIKSVCFSHDVNGLCIRKNTKKTFENIINYLNDFIQSDEVTPIRRIEEERLEKIYPMLSKLWAKVRDKTSYLEEAKPLELQFLLNQMEASNPWARLRLSYIVAMDELQTIRNGHQEKYFKIPRRKKTSNAQCFYDHIDTRVEKLKEAASKLGIDRALYPSHASRFLEEDEKSYIWSEIIGSSDRPSGRIFTAKAEDGKSFREHVENLSFQTILTKEALDSQIQKLPVGIAIEDQREIEMVLKGPMAKKGEFFLELYEMRGNVKKQIDYFEKFSSEHGFPSQYNAKIGFLNLDNALKEPLYRSLMRQAAYTQKMRVLESLNDFCNLEPDDDENFKALFHGTSKNQNNLNRLAGLPTVPEKILDRVNSMSADEWTDLKLGLGAGLLGVAAILLGSACAGLTALTCAPLSIAMVGAATSAMGMQSLLVIREFDRKKNADEHERQIKKMEELGFANKESADEVSRSWFWASFETLTLIPLVGLVSRGAVVGSKLAFVSGKSIMSKSGKMAFKESAKRVLAEADVNLARYVLKFDSLGKDLGLEGAMSKLTRLEKRGKASELAKAGVSKREASLVVIKYQKLMYLFSKGKLTSKGLVEKLSKLIAPFQNLYRGSKKSIAREFQKVTVRESKEVIDKQASKVISEYFKKNPEKFYRVFKSTVGGKRLDKAIKTFEKVKDVTFFVGDFPMLPNNPTVLNKVSRAFKVAGHVGKGLGRLPVTAWPLIRKMRTRHLVNNADKIRLLEKELKTLSARGGDLESFIYKNLDDLTDIFMKAPMRKRETPYLILWQGAAHLAKESQAFGLHHVADGLILRKFFSARGRLVYESLKAEAKKVIGLAGFVSADTTMTAFHSFQESIAAAATQMSEAEGKKILKQYDELQESVSAKLFQNYTKQAEDGSFSYKSGEKVFKMDQEAFQRYIFNPQNIEEKALGHAIWESIPVDELFEMRNLEKMAYRVVQELADYKNIDEFQRFLNALKMVIIQKDPGAVEFM